MFFILSKILAFLISPIVWITTLFCFALFHKNAKRKKQLLIAGISCLFIFSNSFILDECMRAWEYNSEDYIENKGPYEYAIVLGGLSSYDHRLERIQFSSGGDRLFQALPLLYSNKIKTLIISGGSGSLVKKDEKESIFIKEYLRKLNIPDSLILIEKESKNTYENAMFTKKLMDSSKLKQTPFLLITSAFHMRRAIGCFEKAGFTPENIKPFCTDRNSGMRKFEFDHCFIPNPKALEDFTLLIHEVFGYATYKLSGKA